MSLAAAAVPAWEGPAAPDDLKQVDAGGESLTLWPYTTSDFENPSDPINLLFPNADPRAIREELLKLDGNRPAVRGAARWKLQVDRCHGLRAGGLRRAGRLGGRRRPARLRAAGRAARQPLPAAHPALPLGREHARQRALRVPDPGHGRARGPELGPRARVRDLRHGANRRAHGRPERGRAHLSRASSGRSAVLSTSAWCRRAPAPCSPRWASWLRRAATSRSRPAARRGSSWARSTSSPAARASKTTTATRVSYSIVVPRPFCATGPGRLRQARGTPRLLDDRSHQPIGPLRPQLPRGRHPAGDAR